MVADDQLTKGERTRQVILDAAERMFLANGYNGTSMRQIADEAGGIAVGGIYNHFNGKEDIFRALLEARSPYGHILEVLEGLEPTSGPEMLAGAFEKLQVIITQHISFFGLALIDIQEFDGSTVRQLVSRIISHVLVFGQKLQAAGGIRDDVEFVVILRVFSSVMIGYAITNLVAYAADGTMMLDGVPEIDRANWKTDIMDVLLNGIADSSNGGG